MMFSANDPLGIARLGLAAVLIGGGICFIAAGALGLVRFPDFYTRVHAVSTADGAGAGLFALGLAAAAPDLATALRLVLLAALALGLARLNAHLLANAAHAAGLAPLAGPPPLRDGARR
jgi:multicomponent Na+:H+ antiporter subunit G